MTLDTALLHRSTDSLVLSTKRRFFPFNIPNFHHQLRHYISTVDPDIIYLIADRIVYSLHISSQKLESLARITFQPKCLAAGYGWIAVGGSDYGECAFIRIADPIISIYGAVPGHQVDVNRSLPVRTESTSILSSQIPGEESSPRLPPEVHFYKFGGSIVNSVTMHRLPGDGKQFSHEDIIVLSNNDKTVTIYSLTRSKVLEVLRHRACMNYAIISPNSKVLAAVGDENHVYFYEINYDPENTVSLSDSGTRVVEWNWSLLYSQKLQKRTELDDGSCFTVAFSPSSQLCAVGSQSGIITIFDVGTICESKDAGFEIDPILGLFLSSRSCSEGGAVRCMTFSPEPWDLLVWVEDSGRAGVADARQAFTRRQILTLDTNDPALQTIRPEISSLASTNPGVPSPEDGSIYPSNPAARSIDDPHAIQNTVLDTLDASPSNVQGSRTSETQSSRESLVQDLTESERQIIDFLTARRWTSDLDDGSTWTIHLQSGSNPRTASSVDDPNRSSRGTSPYTYNDGLQEFFRRSHLGRTGSTDRTPNPRRQGSVVLSQANSGVNNLPPEGGNPTVEFQPTITLRWTASPPDTQSAERLQEAINDTALMSNTNSNGGNMSPRIREAINLGGVTLDTSSSLSDPTLSGIRQRTQPANSIPRRSERPAGTAESRYEAPRMTTSELRTNVAAERHRRQRLTANEIRSHRWIRNALNGDLSDRGYDLNGTAGAGWGTDGRTLYIATIQGIFEFKLNVQDRKTFPVLACR